MKRPAEYFSNQADEARVTRVWTAVEARLTRAQRRRPWLQAGALAGFLCAWLAFAFALRGARSDGEQARAQQTLQLVDGSRVEHAPGAEVEVQVVTPERVELRMTRGRALFHVTPNKARTFVTHAADYSVRVVGTVFSVELGAERVQVEVSRGEVEVRRDRTGELWRVRAGARWQGGLQQMAAVPALQAPPSAAEMAQSAPTERAGRVDPARVAHRSQSARDEQSADCSHSVGLAPKGPVTSTAAPLHARATAEPRVPSTSSGSAADDLEPAQLFQRALTAELHDSERLLQVFLGRYPHDSRAGLAAFQLGRARLALGDPRGALQALELAAQRDGTFKEQIDARRVQALEQLGERAACQAARDAFLQTYPSGTFTSVVRRRCP